MKYLNAQEGIMEYRANTPTNTVTRHVVIKETDKRITFRYKNNHPWGDNNGYHEQTEAKESRYIKWFESFNEAKSHLVWVAEMRLKHARLELEKEQGRLGNAKGLKQPDLD